MIKNWIVIFVIISSRIALGDDFQAPPPPRDGTLWVSNVACAWTWRGEADLWEAQNLPIVRNLTNAMSSHFDAGKLPRDWDGICSIMARLTETAAPAAVANQNRRWGLMLPGNIDDHKPLVILIHGLDEDGDCCSAMRKLLAEEGWQTAVFCYPAERPIAQTAQLFAEHFAALRQTFPTLHINIVTQSMGGLIARKYIEGNDYAGGVDRLIMIAPPNAGSKWARFSFVEKFSTNWWRWQNDPEWSAAWMINEGLCQSGRDLKPESAFLQELNSHSRRAGVKYTIIAGDLPAGDRVGADVLDVPAEFLSDHSENCSSAAIASGVLRFWADNLREKIGKGDGPVSLRSAMLPGVEDVVILHADHLSLYESIDGKQPAAWPILKNRLESDHAG